MSKRIPPFKDYRYQKNSLITVNIIHHPKMNSINISNYSNNTSINQIQSSLINENQDFYKFRYTLQDKADNSNIVFFDSASRKFRTRSASKSIYPQAISKSIKSIAKINLAKNDKKYNRITNTITIHRNEGNDLKKYNNKTSTYTSIKRISINSNDSKTNKIKERQEKKSQLRNNDNRENEENRPTIGDKYQKNNNDKKVSNFETKKQEIGKKIQSMIPQERNINQRQGNKKQIQKESKTQTNIIINKNEMSNIRLPQQIKNSLKNDNSNPKIISETNKNITSNNNKTYIKNQHNSKITKDEKNGINNEQKKYELKSSLNTKSPIINKISGIISPNKSNEEKKNEIEEPQKRVEEKLNENKDKSKKMNGFGQKEINKINEKKGINIEKSQKIEEKTIALVPGQTIEKKTVAEKFEEPTEEVIENQDGTLDLIFKQTKVTTITENIPVESGKIKLAEGVPNLPIYKQKITYNYETISKSQIKNDEKREKLFQEYRKNEGIEDNDDIDRNLNEEAEFGENEDEDEEEFRRKEKININFDKTIIPKGFKNEKELEDFLNSTNNKEENLTKEEKEKRLNCIKDIFNNISKGANKEQNLKKLAEILGSLNDKERKEILEKLSKDNKNKNLNLFKKLETLLEKEISNNTNLTKKDLDHKKNLLGRKKNSSKMKNQIINVVKIKEINPLKFEGMFLEISQFNTNERKEKNPFDGPSPYDKFYKERSIKIKKKINNMNLVESQQ